MPRIISLLTAIFPLILTIISFVFIVLSTTSKEWAYQDYYAQFNIKVSPEDQITPLYTLYRAPFWTCGTPDNAAPGDYTVLCDRHPLTGHGQRSCEVLAGTNLTSWDPVVGDARQCQQIHMAASLTVSSSVFSGLALVSILVFFPLATFSPFSPHHRHHHQRHHQAGSVLQIFSSWIVACLLLSSALMILAQYYGVLGFVQSAFPNGEFIGATGQGLSASYGPWVQGKASIVYASVGWFAGLLGAVWLVVAFGGRGLGLSGDGEKKREREIEERVE